jgi:two-component system sensor histidine kinase YesM
MDEVEYLGWFIHLSNLRYGNRIECRFDVHEGLGGAAIPRLIIQPLVENAIYHGLAGTGGTWRLVVRIAGGEALTIEVEDKGRGMAVEKLENLRSLLSATGYDGDGWKQTEDTGSSIGLHNVQERIKMKFGENYGLSIESREGEGTLVRLILPLSFNAENGGTDAAYDS